MLNRDTIMQAVLSLPDGGVDVIDDRVVARGSDWFLHPGMEKQKVQLEPSRRRTDETKMHSPTLIRIDETAFNSREYSLRLWEAESLLEGLGYVRGKDHRWRKRITAAEVAEMQRIQGLAS